VELAIFYILAIAAVASAVLMISRSNPVHSALLLVITFGTIAALFVLLRAPLLAVLQVAIYAGAIMVLFVFVIMLLAAERREALAPDPLVAMRWPAYILAAGFLGVMVYVALSPARGVRGDIGEEIIGTHTEVLGRELFTTYLLPFEVTSILLLAAMVGAIVIAKRRLD
jgi:NADH-quinone oxidoreductase subunit J